MKKIAKAMVIMFIMICIMIIYNALVSSIVPLKVSGSSNVENILYAMGAPEKDVPLIANAVRMASRQTDVPENLIIALMVSESNFDRNAVSVSGYTGLMQIPKQYDMKYIDINVLVGARIFREKMYVTHGNVHKAIILYKGWGVTDEKGIYNADKVIRIYKNINDREV